MRSINAPTNVGFRLMLWSSHFLGRFHGQVTSYPLTQGGAYIKLMLLYEPNEFYRYYGEKEEVEKAQHIPCFCWTDLASTEPDYDWCRCVTIKSVVDLGIFYNLRNIDWSAAFVTLFLFRTMQKTSTKSGIVFFRSLRDLASIDTVFPFTEWENSVNTNMCSEVKLHYRRKHRISYREKERVERVEHLV